ncbi:hypothetical protein OAF54_03370, partial [bacterium]|nr:hypothetical protein [bacterium]
KARVRGWPRLRWLPDSPALFYTWKRPGGSVINPEAYVLCSVEHRAGQLPPGEYTLKSEKTIKED